MNLDAPVTRRQALMLVLFVLIALHVGVAVAYIFSPFPNRAIEIGWGAGFVVFLLLIALALGVYPHD